MIIGHYVLFTRVALFKSPEGKLFCDPLWAKDLKLHLVYLPDFSLCCPVVDVIPEFDTSGLEDITEFTIKHIYALKKDSGLKSVIRSFLPNFNVVKKASVAADIVHSGGAGWAFPLSFYLLLIRPFKKFKWVMVIESSFWMIQKGEKVTVRKFLEHHIYSILLKRCVRSADVRIFTQSFYKKYFIGANDNALIAPATWVDESYIVGEKVFRERFELRATKPLEILFPARLEKEKGVYIVFEAIEQLARLISKPVSITFMGQGKLKGECKAFCQRQFSQVLVQFREPVEYGTLFFQALASYDVVLVANLAEEQPRIVYDAFSQGCVVVGANTSGISHITRPGIDSVLFERGDSLDLAAKLNKLIEQPQLILDMGLEAINCVQNKTHEQMHIVRASSLKPILN